MRWVSTLCLFAAVAAAFAADDAGPAIKAQATALTVRKPLPSKKKEAFNFTPPGTTLEITLSAPGKYILGIDIKASKLDHFTDDKKTKLNTSGGLFGPSWLSEYVQIPLDGEQCTVQLSAGTAPVKEALKVLVKGVVVLNCGTEEKTLEKKDIAIKKNTETAVGSYNVKITQEGSNFAGPAIQIISEARDVKHAEFFDAKGAAIVLTSPPFRHNVFSGAGKMQHAISYTLPKKIDAVSVKITYFGKVEPMKAPFDLSVGIGLD